MKKSLGQIIALILTITYIITAIVLAVIHSQWIGNTISREWQYKLDEGQSQAVISYPILFVLLGVFIVSLVGAIHIHKKKKCNKKIEYGNRIKEETTKWGYVRDVMIVIAFVSFFSVVHLGYDLITPVLTMTLGIIMILAILAIPPYIGFAIFKN